MTLDDLRAELAKLDHLPGDTGMYDADTTWSGDRYMTDEDRAATGEPDEYSEAPESAVPAVFLWPTN